MLRISEISGSKCDYDVQVYIYIYIDIYIYTRFFIRKPFHKKT